MMKGNVGIVAAILTLLSTAGSPGYAQTVETVLSGLDNPRGLAFGPEGALYVVEAGRGGAGPSVFLRGALFSYGPTGAVTRLWKGVQSRFATGLPSMVNAAGEVTGPHDISFQGRGGAFVTVGFGADPALRAGFGEPGAVFGTLVKVSANGGWRVVTDVAAHESATNPAGGPIDSNPFGLLAEPSGLMVADAGGNSLLRVSAAGAVSTVATFPARPVRSTDSVPTSVSAGPDGAYYVSELTGVPFAAGAARIYRVNYRPRYVGDPSVYLDGFKAIIDIAHAPDGSLYVLEHAGGPVFFTEPGRVIRVSAGGARTTVVDGLDRPTSIVVGGDGVLYVTNHGVSIGGGEVLRITP